MAKEISEIIFDDETFEIADEKLREDMNTLKDDLSSFYITSGRESGTQLGSKATAEGVSTEAKGDYSHAEGSNTHAIGRSSHAEGTMTHATMQAAHSEGDNTTASGQSSHAEGRNTTASSQASHAEGWLSSAIGYVSHAEGHGTVANRKYQHVFGEYNVIDTEGSSYTEKGEFVEIVGNGTSEESRSNIRTLDWNGNETIAGTLSQGSDARCKDVVNEDIPDVSNIKAVRFYWNESKINGDKKEHIGYLAQDVEEVLPYLVSTDSKGYKYLDYIAFLCAKVDSLEKRITELEGTQPLQSKKTGRKKKDIEENKIDK